MTKKKQTQYVDEKKRNEEGKRQYNEEE